MGSLSEETNARLVGRYVLYGEIAAGGMATVHFGRLSGPVGFSRTVAIKRLHPQFAKDPEFVTMFLDEARLAGRIRHPNVVPTLDVVATEGEIFLVMEYVQGESLARLARSMRTKRSHMPAKIVSTIMSGVLHGLHSAHEAKDEQGQPLGIVHRDVSPQNVLVGTDGVARVLDFGVAKAAGRLQTTREGQIKGKIAYMAPEQLNGGAINRKTDIYAAAVVIWETLTGRRLFEGDNEAVVVVKALEGRVDPPSKLVPGLSEAVDDVVLRGLARDPNQRYATAREMAIALEKTVGLAAPSEIGEWVESIAHEDLAKRAHRIAEIESSSTSDSGTSKKYDSASQISEVSSSQILDQMVASQAAAKAAESISRVAPPPPSAPSAGFAVADPKSEISQLSSISVSRNGSLYAGLGSRGTSNKKPVVAFALGGVAILGLVFMLGMGVRSGDSKSPAATGSSSQTAPRPPSAQTAAVELPAATPPPPPPPPVAETSAVDAGHVTLHVAPAITPVSTSRPTIAAPRPTTPPVTPPASKPTRSCDPPYSTDASGIKHYFPECLK